MEYVELDFLGTTADIDPNFLKLFEEITGQKLKKRSKIKNQISRAKSSFRIFLCR